MVEKNDLKAKNSTKDRQTSENLKGFHDRRRTTTTGHNKEELQI